MIPAGSHSSRAVVTGGLQQPTRIRYGPYLGIPIWPCSGRGLPSHRCYHPRGALLPHPFTLTAKPLAPRRRLRGGLLSAALSVSSRFPGVTWRPVLWSPDFPLAAKAQAPAASGCLASSAFSLRLWTLVCQRESWPLGAKIRWEFGWRQTPSAGGGAVDPGCQPVSWPLGAKIRWEGGGAGCFSGFCWEVGFKRLGGRGLGIGLPRPGRSGRPFGHRTGASSPAPPWRGAVPPPRRPARAVDPMALGPVPR